MMDCSAGICAVCIVIHVNIILFIGGDLALVMTLGLFRAGGTLLNNTNNTHKAISHIQPIVIKVIFSLRIHLDCEAFKELFVSRMDHII